ncbi:MAG: dTDP-glucose 4,6-dehydratase [Candidatus Atribacteria bacterium]|nr:dTDP-glucose 4,6-dehydratase [Candidatus Atribacteria bacterium]
MRKRVPKILVTGGAGFIGSAFVRLLLNRDCPESLHKLQGIHPERSEGPSKLGGFSLIVVDKLTYAGDLARLQEVKGKYKFYKADICDKIKIEAVFKKEKPQILVNFAAETHVDRSILDPTAFIKTNVMGTQVLLDLSRKYKIKQFIHLSTDEVYGDIEKGKFNEDSPLKPNSPYAASKAAADLLIRSYIRTYGFPAIIIRPCNNYGPWQYPETLIPLAILKILRNAKIPVYGNGKNVREWLYVADCAEGIYRIFNRGRIGEIYNLGSICARQNVVVVKNLLTILGKNKSMIEFVKDRPGHDFRYSLDSSKVFRELEWRPTRSLYEGLKITVQWGLEHRKWLLSKWK